MTRPIQAVRDAQSSVPLREGTLEPPRPITGRQSSLFVGYGPDRLSQS